MTTSTLLSSALSAYQALIPEINTRSPLVRNTMRQPAALPTVTRLLDLVTPLPAHALLLGQCFDGLPFLLSLNNPQIGAMLTVCEPGCGKTHQLQVMADSAMLINEPHDLQIGVVTLNPQEWEGVFVEPRHSRYNNGLLGWYESRLRGYVESLMRLAEDRRNGKRFGTQMLVLLDDLDAVDGLDYDLQYNLHWLLENGASLGIWLAASLDVEKATAMPYWVQVMRTQIFGRVRASAQAQALAFHQGALTADLQPGEFTTWTGRSWLSYRLPLLG